MSSVKPILTRCLSTSDMGFLPLIRDCVRIPCLNLVDFSGFKIMQSCNGLLLRVSSALVYVSKRNFICNLTTRNFKIISLRSLDVKDYRLCGVNFAFDPLRSPYYKIISVWQQVVKKRILPKVQYFIDIYSSKTSSWSFSKIKFITSKERIKFDHGVYFKGAIHWYSRLRESLYFDAENECLKPIQMPRIGYGGYHSFGDSGGHLYLAVAHMFSYLKYSVFEMAEDRSHWYLKYSVNLEAEMDVMPNKMFGSPGISKDITFKLFCVIQSEEEGDTMFIVDGDGTGISYNFKDCTRKDVHCTVPITPRIEYYGLHDLFIRRCSQYFETLSCI